MSATTTTTTTTTSSTSRGNVRRWGSWMLALILAWTGMLRVARGAALTSGPVDPGYKQFLLFPASSSSMGVFFALSVPLDSIHHDVSLAYNFEANYALPSNATALADLEAQYGFKRGHGRSSDGHGQDHAEDAVKEAIKDAVKAPPKRTLRDLGRSDVYAMLQASIHRAGLPGKACLLRSICEASEWPMAEGLLGNFLTVLLTPSSSHDEDVHPAFHAAERRGRRGADCAVHYQGCPLSLLGLLTEH